jgi:hypothetical protein
MNEIDNDKLTVLYPGGFKPPHIGHLSLINKVLERSDIDNLYIMISSRNREDITPKISLEIWNMLISSEKVAPYIVSENSPVLAAYNFIFDLPQDSNKKLTMLSSDKDAGRFGNFKKSIHRYKTYPDKFGNYTPPNVEVIDLNIDVAAIYKERTDDLNESYVSSSTLREDLKNRDFDNFKTNYLGIDNDIILKIYDLLINNQLLTNQ